MDFKTPDFKPPQKLDIHVVGVVVILVAMAALTVVGDQGTFVRPPNNFFENVLTLMPVIGFKLTGTRVYADAFASIIYGLIIATMAFFLFKLYQDKVMWPSFIKKMIKQRKREQALMNEHGGSDLL